MDEKGQASVVIVIALVIALVIGIAAGYFIAPTHEEELSATKEKLREAMGRIAGMSIPALENMLVSLEAIPALNEPVTYHLSAFVIGPGPIGFKKATNLELGADTLNFLLEMRDLPARVEVEVEFSELKWGPYWDKFIVAHEAGVAPDIFTYRELGMVAEGGFAVPMTEHVETFWDTHYYDWYPNLWDSMTYEGETWGIVHDVCPHGLWYRKDMLRELGYTDAQIEGMMPADGDTTWDKVADLAKEAVDAGLVEFGILHRPKKGDQFYSRLSTFGVDYFNPETGNLVLDKPALTTFYEWHRNLVEEGVIPSEPPGWSTIHGSFVEGTAFATCASHVGTPGEWMEKYGLKESTLEEDLGFMAFPRGVPDAEPVSVIDLVLYYVSSQSEHPEVAELVIMFGTSVEACAVHSQFTKRPPYRESALEHPLLVGEDYIQRVAPSVTAIAPAPLHPEFGSFMTQVYEGLKGVEAGVVTPATAVDDLEAWVTANIPATEIIP